MLYFIITIFTIGLILNPLGTLYIVYEARKPGSKYANKTFTNVSEQKWFY